MPSGKEEKSMDIKKATIQRVDQVYLLLHLKDQDIRITLTDDNLSNIKAAFNKLLVELKKGSFTFELDDASEDLYHHICMEYVSQLNVELNSIYAELADFDLLEAS